MRDNNARKTTLEDLAKLAGVSVSTVSRALNDHSLISTTTKRRVWALAHEHGYAFRTSMPSAPIGSEGSIVVVTPHVHGRPLPLSHPFFLELLASIGEAARARSCDFTVSHVSPGTYEDVVAASTTSRANGAIFLGQGQLHEAFNELAESNVRFVVWGAQMPGQKYLSIGSDNFVGGKRAASHLARLGRKRIVFMGGTDPEARQRLQGYKAALEEAGLPIDENLIVPVEFELEQADAATCHLLELGLDFDGLVAGSDLIALGAMQALQRSGRTIPGDVSVVGYDDMLLARLSSPKLTTIRQDTQMAGRRLVSSIMDNRPTTSLNRLPTELVIRETCGG